ncbi:hypothetical protein Celaphus_00012340, partial [Cervus elaphus hippelaphus]
MKRHRETKETSLIASRLNNSVTIALSWTWAPLQLGDLAPHASVSSFPSFLLASVDAGVSQSQDTYIMKRHRETKETSLIASRLNNSVTIALSWTWAPLQLGDLAPHA